MSTKLSTLHSKNNFSFAIVVGDLFDEDDDAVADLLAENISIPLPTYFTVGVKPLPQRVVDRLSKDEDVSFLPLLKPPIVHSTASTIIPSQVVSAVTQDLKWSRAISALNQCAYNLLDLPKFAFSGKAKYYENLRRHPNRYPWRTPRRYHRRRCFKGAISPFPYYG